MADSVGKSLEAARLSSIALKQTTTFPLRELKEPEFAKKYKLGHAIGHGGFGVVYGAIRIDNNFPGIYYLLIILHVIFTFD